MKKTFANLFMNWEYEILWTLIVDCKPSQYAGSIDNKSKAMIVDKSKTSQFTESCSQSGFRENTAAAGRSVIADRRFV